MTSVEGKTRVVVRGPDVKSLTIFKYVALFFFLHGGEGGGQGGHGTPSASKLFFNTRRF